MADLTQTSFYGAGRSESLRGPKGEKGDEGPQGPPGPLIPPSTFADNASAIAAGLTLGTLYSTPTGEARFVIQGL